MTIRYEKMTLHRIGHEAGRMLCAPGSQNVGWPGCVVGPGPALCGNGDYASAFAQSCDDGVEAKGFDTICYDGPAAKGTYQA